MEARNYLKSQDYYFQYFGYNSVKESYRTAINAWNRLKRIYTDKTEEFLEHEEVVSIYKLLTKKI